MEQLKQKSFKILEFDKILEKLSSYTESESVKKQITELEPYTSVLKAREAQRETTEALVTMLKLGSPPVNLSVKAVTASV